MAWSGKRAHETSYEALVDDFPSEAARLLSFAGLDGVDLADLQAETSLERLRATRGDERGIFFRKGETGQHQTFDWPSDIQQDISRLASLDRLGLMRERASDMLKQACRKLTSARSDDRHPVDVSSE